VPAGATTGPVTITTANGISNGPTFTVLTRTDLLTNKNWRMIAATVDPPLPTGGAGTTDLFADQLDCDKDNLLRFELPNTFRYDEGPTKCSASDPQTVTGTWVFSAGETKLRIIYTRNGNTIDETGDVLELTETRFKRSYVINFQGVDYTITETHISQ
jgi:hypothetical protein